MALSLEALGPLADWIASTAVSESLRDQLWVIPTSQSIHIIAISVFFVSALLVSLRLLGVGRYERPLSAAIGRHARLMYWSLVILLTTGIVQTTAEPVRQLLTLAFWIKMSLILFGITMTYWLTQQVRRDPGRWDPHTARPGWSRPAAAIAIATWVAVIFLGRFIGYTHR